MTKPHLVTQIPYRTGFENTLDLKFKNINFSKLLDKGTKVLKRDESLRFSFRLDVFSFFHVLAFVSTGVKPNFGPSSSLLG